MSEEVMDGPLDHLERAMPPWHTGPALTECGRSAGDVKSIVTRDAVKSKIAKQGKKRAAFSTCMSCAETSDRYARWRGGAATVIARWANAAERQRFDPAENGNRQNRELLALGMLLDAHRQEFVELVEALEQTTDLDAARRRTQMRRVQ